VNYVAPEAGKASLRLQDLQGKTLERVEMEAEIGVNGIQIDTSHLADGIYFLDLHLGSNWIKKKVVIL
jgi:hypothetical protein